MANPFATLAVETKTITVKGLGNAEVTIREMTYNEALDFSNRLFNGVKEDGSPSFDAKAYIAMRAEKVSKCMVEPKMSIKEINELPAHAADAIAEIAEAIDNFKGNSAKS